MQKVIWDCKHPFYIGHIGAHTGLLLPLSWNNEVSDLGTKDPLIFNHIEEATNFHSKFHVNAPTLKEHFKVTRTEAQDIVHACPRCVMTLPAPSLGSNPKGSLPSHIWQMDVTYIPEFGKLAFVHVSVDTCSGFLMATPLSREKSKDVVTHCLNSFTILGLPKHLKTDNAPGYTSATFRQFCTTFGIQHVIGFPYNPIGQGIVE